LGEKGFLIAAEWPSFDPALTIDAVVTLAIQVNGKMRGSLEVARDAAEDEIRKQALAVPNVVKHLDGKTVRKVIVVPGRIVNIVWLAAAISVSLVCRNSDTVDALAPIRHSNRKWAFEGPALALRRLPRFEENQESLRRTCAARLEKRLVGTFIAYRRRRRCCPAS
jgi:hypothetical protein